MGMQHQLDDTVRYPDTEVLHLHGKQVPDHLLLHRSGWMLGIPASDVFLHHQVR